MGQTSTETKREIEELRAQTTTLLVEIEDRVRYALDVRAQIREHPGIAAGIGGGLAAGLGLTTLLVYHRIQARREARRRAQQGWRMAAEQLAENLPFRIAQRDGQLDLAGLPVEKEPSLPQRLIWTLVATGSTALASYLARQLTETLWPRGFGELPPEP